jgi:hypothetical protein
LPRLATEQETSDADENSVVMASENKSDVATASKDEG